MNLNKVSRIIGVDPGLNKTGFGILDYKGTKTKMVAYGLISPPPKESLPNRLEYLNSHMNDLIDNYEFSYLNILVSDIRNEKLNRCKIIAVRQVCGWSLFGRWS